MSVSRRLTEAERLERRRTRGHSSHLLHVGELYRRPCEVCGAEPAECHHIDYSAPERVMWLCTAHHKQTDSQFGKPAPDWMADIRAAMKKIDAARLAGRARRRPADSNSSADLR
jgi:hypothetical protein